MEVVPVAPVQPDKEALKVLSSEPEIARSEVAERDTAEEHLKTAADDLKCTSPQASKEAGFSDALSEAESADALAGADDASSEETVSSSAEPDAAADLETAAEDPNCASAEASDQAGSSDAPLDAESEDVSSGAGDASLEEAANASAEPDTAAGDWTLQHSSQTCQLKLLN